MVSNRGETLKLVESQYAKNELPPFDVGDTIKMKVKVQEADKVRMHPFEGTVIRKTGGGIKGSFTVRKLSFGEGVERIFPMYSPVIEELKVVSKGVTTQSNLYFLRGRVGKKARVKKKVEQ